MKEHKILYVQYSNPAAYPPLEHSSRLLAAAGWKVLFLGIGAFDRADSLQFPPHPNIVVRKCPYYAPGWRQKINYVWFCLWVVLWVIRWRPRWIYVSDPLSSPAGWILSFLPSLRVLYHEHDSPNITYQGGVVRSVAFKRMVLWARRKLIPRTKLCILPNQERVRRFMEEMRAEIKIFCIWNCLTQEEVSHPRRVHQGGDFWVVYHGSIVPPRLPLTMIEALATTPLTVKLRIIGYETIGSLGYLQQMKDEASKLGISDRIEFVGALPTRQDVLKCCQLCDVGLSFVQKKSQDLNQQTMVGASNKPFDYLACGLALLVSDLPEWRKTFVDPGYGLACDPDDPKSIAEALRWFLEHPEETRAMGERGRQRILQEWNYERQFAPVLERLEGEK